MLVCLCGTVGYAGTKFVGVVGWLGEVLFACLLRCFSCILRYTVAFFLLKWLLGNVYTHVPGDIKNSEALNLRSGYCEQDTSYSV